MDAGCASTSTRTGGSRWGGQARATADLRSFLRRTGLALALVVGAPSLLLAAEALGAPAVVTLPGRALALAAFLWGLAIAVPLRREQRRRIREDALQSVDDRQEGLTPRRLPGSPAPRHATTAVALAAGLQGVVHVPADRVVEVARPTGTDGRVAVVRLVDGTSLTYTAHDPRLADLLARVTGR